MTKVTQRIPQLDAEMHVSESDSIAHRRVVGRSGAVGWTVRLLPEGLQGWAKCQGRTAVQTSQRVQVAAKLSRHRTVRLEKLPERAAAVADNTGVG